MSELTDALWDILLFGVTGFTIGWVWMFIATYPLRLEKEKWWKRKK